MRGEDFNDVTKVVFDEGSPPHARGRRDLLCRSHHGRGITPACAGKTRPTPRTSHTGWDHPRMRGEDAKQMSPVKRACGSPPHARGRPRHRRHLLRKRRITPACAGKTLVVVDVAAARDHHPRMRGEDSVNSQVVRVREGSPPHARGRLTHCRTSRRIGRITPACAGKTSS